MALVRKVIRSETTWEWTAFFAVAMILTFVTLRLALQAQVAGF